MPEYKHIHTIPASILRYWIDANTSYKGVHVYENQSRRIYVSTGQGPKAFSFAITDDLYITTANGKRAVGLEKWFSGQEDSLISFVRQVHNRQQLSSIPSSKFTQLLMAIVGLECRSAYNIRKIQEIIEKDVSIRTKISDSPDHSPEQLVLENIIHWVNEQIASICPTEMVLFIAPYEHSWVIGDRPYFYHKDLEFHFVVLTNKVVIGYRRSNELTYEYKDVSKEFVELINHQITINSREWLVAINAEELSKYVGLFNSEAWKQSVDSEKVGWLPIQYLTNGWLIDR